MNESHSPGAGGAGGAGGATSVATIVLALLSALALAGAALIGVGQLTGHRAAPVSAAAGELRPPSPVTLLPKAPQPRDELPTGRRVAAPRNVGSPDVLAPVPLGKLAGFFRSLDRLAASAGAIRGGQTSPKEASPSGRLTPSPSQGRTLSLGKPRTGQTWSGVKNGQTWSGVKNGQTWSGVKNGQTWSGVKKGQSWSGVKKPPAKQRNKLRQLRVSGATRVLGTKQGRGEGDTSNRGHTDRKPIHTERKDAKRAHAGSRITSPAASPAKCLAKTAGPHPHESASAKGDHARGKRAHK